MVLTRTDLADVLADNLAMFEADIRTGVISWASHTMELLFGYTMAGALEGLYVEELLAPELREEHVKVQRPSYDANPRPLELRAVRCVRKDKTRFMADVTLLPKAVAGHRVMVALVKEVKP